MLIEGRSIDCGKRACFFTFECFRTRRRKGAQSSAAKQKEEEVIQHLHKASLVKAQQVGSAMWGRRHKEQLRESICEHTQTSFEHAEEGQ